MVFHKAVYWSQSFLISIRTIIPGARHFIYADDTAISIQDNNFEGVGTKLETSFKTMTTYYKSIKLKPNLTKTQI